jgi:sugar phosphate isomerase/epimerase
MWRVTIFADEVDPVYAGQAEFIRSEGLDGIDVRNANGRNVIDLTDEDIREIAASGIPVQSVGSPVNKVALDASLAEAELAKFARAVDKAIRLQSRRIRIFTPEPKKDADPAADWPLVRAWLRPMVDLAEKNGLIVLHENDWYFYGAYPANAQRMFAEFGGPCFRAAFDFANAVFASTRAMDDWFPWLLPHLDTLHIKDYVEAENRVVVAGAGDGQVEETLGYLAAEGWEGTLSLEPHLAEAGQFGGYSGPENCSRAHAALARILERL